MTEKCITLNDILYKNKHYRIDKIIFVDDKDVRKLEKLGAVRRLEKPKIKRVIRPVRHVIYPEDKELKEIKFSSKKIKKFTKSKKKEGSSYAHTKT